jgi:hypothetical protein
LDSYFGNVLIPGFKNWSYRKKTPAWQAAFLDGNCISPSSFSKNLIEVKRHEV